MKRKATRILAMLLTALLVLSACGGNNNQPADNNNQPADNNNANTPATPTTPTPPPPSPPPPATAASPSRTW